jgi:hypothetical protein
MTTEPNLVELLYFDGCPGIERVLPLVRPLAEAAGARVVQRRVETAHGAEQREDFGGKCRRYQTANGLSGVPEADWVRAALERTRSGQHGVDR